MYVEVARVYLVLKCAMAADTREPQEAPLDHHTAPTTASTQGKTYENFSAPAAPENVNALPGGGLNTAGGRPKEAGLLEAIKTVRVDELMEVHKKPCARDALLTGIGAGFGMGGLRIIIGCEYFNSITLTISDRDQRQHSEPATGLLALSVLALSPCMNSVKEKGNWKCKA